MSNFFFRCCCGRLKEKHLFQFEPSKESIDGIESSNCNDSADQRWDTNKHFGTRETNAYGDIEFRSAGKLSKAKVWWRHLFFKISFCMK